MPPKRAKTVRAMPKGEEEGEVGEMRRRARTEKKQKAEIAENERKLKELIFGIWNIESQGRRNVDQTIGFWYREGQQKMAPKYVKGHKGRH